MAELEAEALLLGIWKNIAELEEALNLDELKAILSASREREHRQNKFLAAINNIDLDAGEQTNEEKFEEVKRRAEAKLSGIDERELELDMFGIDFDTEEE